MSRSPAYRSPNSSDDSLANAHAYTSTNRSHASHTRDASHARDAQLPRVHPNNAPIYTGLTGTGTRQQFSNSEMQRGQNAQNAYVQNAYAPNQSGYASNNSWYASSESSYVQPGPGTHSASQAERQKTRERRPAPQQPPPVQQQSYQQQQQQYQQPPQQQQAQQAKPQRYQQPQQQQQQPQPQQQPQRYQQQPQRYQQQQQQQQQPPQRYQQQQQLQQHSISSLEPHSTYEHHSPQHSLPFPQQWGGQPSSERERGRVATTTAFTTTTTPTTTPPHQQGRFLYRANDFLSRDVTLCHVTASLAAWCACALLGVTAVLYVTAFSLPEWGVLTVVASGVRTRCGLWQCCRVGGSCWSLVADRDTTGWYRFAQTLGTLAMTSLLVGVLPLVLYCAFPTLQDRRGLRVAALTLRVLTALFLLLTCVVFANTWYKPVYDNPNYSHYLSHGYGLSAAACAMETLACVLLYIALRHTARLVRMRKVEDQERRREWDRANGIQQGSDEAVHDSSQARIMSPFQAFQQYSGIDSDNSFEQNGKQDQYSGIRQGEINAAYRRDTDDSDLLSEQSYSNNKYQIKAELHHNRSNASNPHMSNTTHSFMSNDSHQSITHDISTQNMNQFRNPTYGQGHAPATAYSSPQKGPYRPDPNSYENLPDGSSQPGTPVSERRATQQQQQEQQQRGSQNTTSANAERRSQRRKSRRQNRHRGTPEMSQESTFDDLDELPLSSGRDSSMDKANSPVTVSAKTYTNVPAKSYESVGAVPYKTYESTGAVPPKTYDNMGAKPKKYMDSAVTDSMHLMHTTSDSGYKTRRSKPKAHEDTGVKP